MADASWRNTVAITVKITLMLVLTWGAVAFNVQAGGMEEAHPVVSGTERPKRVPGTDYAIAGAHPLAAAAGDEILAAGGSAVDAAIAMQLVLGLVEPQSSGIGGGGFMLHFDPAAKGEKLSAFDGRETAPSSSRPDQFARYAGKGRDGFYDAVLGGHSVGTPGVVALLAKAHARYGVLPWARLFDPAIKLAEAGFLVTPRLHYLLDRDPLLRKMPKARAYFYDMDGGAHPVGYRLKNPEYAASLQMLAREGAAAFYTGALAQDIVTAVQQAVSNPGHLSLEDMGAYEAKVRAPVCGAYRIWHICGMPAPSSGGTTVAAILGMVERFELATYPPNDPEAIHLILEASRLAFADRNRYVADGDFVTVPTNGLIDKSYLAERSALIDAGKAMGKAVAGEPPTDHPLARVNGYTPELPSTTHFVIVDGAGRVVSMTSSVENAFGSRVMVGGFFLNNQLTDFSFVPEREGVAVANALAPGKRPRSSMSPTIVLDREKRPVLAIGSPGGSNIIGYVAQSLINILDWEMDVRTAISQPHFLNKNGQTYLERADQVTELQAALAAKGHVVQQRTLNSGLHGVKIEYLQPASGPMIRHLTGGADPRREGQFKVGRHVVIKDPLRKEQ